MVKTERAVATEGSGGAGLGRSLIWTHVDGRWIDRLGTLEAARLSALLLWAIGGILCDGLRGFITTEHASAHRHSSVEVLVDHGVDS